LVNLFELYDDARTCQRQIEKVVRRPPTYFLQCYMLHAICANPFVFTPSALKTLNTVVVRHVIHNTQQQQQSSAMQSGDHDGRIRFSPFFNVSLQLFQKTALKLAGALVNL